MKTRSTNYQQDRAYTEYVHRHIALPHVYRLLDWSPFYLSKQERIQLDLHKGIDRVFYTSESKLVTVQERFRTAAYANYQDVTFRYRRDQHADSQRRYSEFYKIKADYLLYGITDSHSKNLATPPTGFSKVVLIELAPLWKKLEAKEAVIDETKTGQCYWQQEMLIVPVNHNRDGSSSFIAWDIPLIARHWSQDIIVYQQGYIP